MGRELWNATTEVGRLQHRLIRRLTYAGLVPFALGVAWWLLAGFVDLAVLFDALGRGAAGAAAVAGGVILLPFTYTVAPLYAGLVRADWMPLVFSAAGSCLLALLGRLMTRSNPRRVR